MSTLSPQPIKRRIVTIQSTVDRAEPKLTLSAIMPVAHHQRAGFPPIKFKPMGLTDVEAAKDQLGF